jgi:protein-L-isoaspartate(D-aspartate) O-methyltransferase
MVEGQLAGRGITDEAVLHAMVEVSRESFAPDALAEYAADDAAIVVRPGVLVPQPFLTALALQALELTDRRSVLEIGTGTGYLTALLGLLAKHVTSIDRNGFSARRVEERLGSLGVTNVSFRTGIPAGDAAFDCVVALDTDEDAIRDHQALVAVGGVLVAALRTSLAEREVVRIRRISPDTFQRELVARVTFVILPSGTDEPISIFGRLLQRARPRLDGAVSRLVAESAEPLDSIDGADLGPLVDRIPDDTCLVLIGEASHGTSEFYRMRARITRELIAHRGFHFVAAEADWPDASHLHRWATGRPPIGDPSTAFARFPTWMWRNQEVGEFVDWLRRWNAEIREPRARVGFHGLDLYSLHTSLHAVLSYLDDTDADAAGLARERYGCLTPLSLNPAEYGRFAITGRYRSCEQSVVTMLTDLLRRRIEFGARDFERYFDAELNARLVRDAERYYRAMYYGSIESWNLRDRHMFETLERLRQHYGPDSRGIVWAHNSHLGDARATELGHRGELNLGQLCRAGYGHRSCAVGFGTDHGTVAAASDWDGPMEQKRVRPALAESYEALCRDSGVPAFLLHLRDPRRAEIREELLVPRLERAIGVIYRPETERQSHYFGASLPEQFDEYIWFEETKAVHVEGDFGLR